MWFEFFGVGRVWGFGSVIISVCWQCVENLLFYVVAAVKYCFTVLMNEKKCRLKIFHMIQARLQISMNTYCRILVS